MYRYQNEVAIFNCNEGGTASRSRPFLGIWSTFLFGFLMTKEN